MDASADRSTAQHGDRPRDAATLIIIDRSTGTPRVLMGRRHPNQIFLPKDRKSVV